jgi:hypothetical protein
MRGSHLHMSLHSLPDLSQIETWTSRKHKRHRDLGTNDLFGACLFHLLPVNGQTLQSTRMWSLIGESQVSERLPVYL